MGRGRAFRESDLRQNQTSDYIAVIETLEPRRLMAAGVAGTYYNNTNFTGKSVTRLDAMVNFPSVTPPKGVTASTYSVRWVATLTPSTTETYTFSTRSDDGIRLWVNHKLIIDNFKPHTVAEASGSIALVAGRQYDLLIEYFNNTGPAVAQLYWSTPTIAKQIVPTSALVARRSNLKDQIDHEFTFAEAQYTKAIAQIGKTSLDAYDNSTTASLWTTTGPTAWTAGFFPGAMWQIYTHNTKKSWRLNATAWTRPIAPSASNGDDVGFRLWTSYFPMAGSTKLASDKTVLIQAADAKMKNFNSTVGMFETAPPATKTANNFTVVLDQTMDMELLWWAWKETGKTSYRDAAESNLLTLAQYMIRNDGSTMQVATFNRNDGHFIAGGVKQGYNSLSTWSRGQAWAIDAYATAYQQTKLPAFLTIAQKLADYWVAHVPSDGVPYWDFDAPAIPNTYRDTSAAAVGASGLILLSELSTGDKISSYLASASTTLSSLLSKTYSAEGVASPGLLLHSAHWVSKKQDVDNSMIYADYYFLQALNRFESLA